jgi:hypothetical protein
MSRPFVKTIYNIVTLLFDHRVPSAHHLVHASRALSCVQLWLAERPATGCISQDQHRHWPCPHSPGTPPNVVRYRHTVSRAGIRSFEHAMNTRPATVHPRRV